MLDILCIMSLVLKVKSRITEITYPYIYYKGGEGDSNLKQFCDKWLVW